MDIEDINDNILFNNYANIYKITFESFHKIIIIIISLCKDKYNDVNTFNKALQKIQRKNRDNSKVSVIRDVYNFLVKINHIKINYEFEEFCSFKQSRKNQGILVIAVLMSDKPDGKLMTCKNNCYYCPNVEGYSRSYYPLEPAVERGYQCGWDPILQVISRLNVYATNGYIFSDIKEIERRNIKGYKVDVIIEGGSYNSYPERYRKEFITKLFYACNTYFDKEKREMYSIDIEKKINTTSIIRIIGLSIETRADLINNDLIKELRIFGVTRVQMGIQHTNDEILKFVNRNSTLIETKQALKILFDNGFKVSIHIMPDLPGSSPELDSEMFELLFNDDCLEFDYVKFYPCVVMPYTKIIEWFMNGTYKPYANELVDYVVDGKIEKISKMVLITIQFMSMCKKHQRVERIERDLPTSKQVGGCNTTNLRQIIEIIMNKNKIICREIRCREIKNKNVNMDNIDIFIDKYSAHVGTEYFISFETKDEKTIIGFIRLRIPDIDSVCIDELKNSTIIREIHIYGQPSSIGHNTSSSYQHKGFGTKLLFKAIEISKSFGFNKIAVISGEGVKGFYEKFGFYNGEYYMYKDI